MAHETISNDDIISKKHTISTKVLAKDNISNNDDFNFYKSIWATDSGKDNSSIAEIIKKHKSALQVQKDKGSSFDDFSFVNNVYDSNVTPTESSDLSLKKTISNSTKQDNSSSSARKNNFVVSGTTESRECV